MSKALLVLYKKLYWSEWVSLHFAQLLTKALERIGQLELSLRSYVTYLWANSLWEKIPPQLPLTKEDRFPPCNPIHPVFSFWRILRCRVSPVEPVHWVYFIKRICQSLCIWTGAIESFALYQWGAGGAVEDMLPAGGTLVWGHLPMSPTWESIALLTHSLIHPFLTTGHPKTSLYE